MWTARIRDGIFLKLSNNLCENLPGILLGCKAVAICFASFFQIVCRVPMFLSSRKRSYFLYIQNLNAPARARVRDPSARFMSHKSPGKQGVDVAGAAQRSANQDTQHHHVAAIKDCISHITSFCSGGKHLVLHENQTACSIESGATAMLWYFMVCLHVFPCDLVYLSILIYCTSNVQGTFHQPPCFGTLPGKKTAPPWRTTSRWLWRRSFQPPVRFPRERCWRTSGTSAQNLGISGPPLKNRNLPEFTLYRKPSQSLRFAETPSTIPLWHPGVGGKALNFCGRINSCIP